MKKILTMLALAILMGCGGNSERTEKDLTDSDEQNISPNQQITEEEQAKKDSTSLDVVGKDTARSK